MSFAKTGADSLSIVDLHTLATVNADAQSTGVNVSGYKGVGKIVLAVE